MRIKKRYGAVGLFVTGLMTIGTGLALEGTAGAAPVLDRTGKELFLKDSQQGSTWASAVGSEDECEGSDAITPAGYDYLWHFVVPSFPGGKNGGTPDVTAIQTLFAAGIGNVDTGHVVQDGKGWNVYTQNAGTLLDATGDSTAANGVLVEMNLSHTCGPEGSTSSSSTSQTSSTGSSVSSSSTSQSSSTESSVASSSVSSSSTSQSSSTESSESSVSSSSTSQSSVSSSSTSRTIFSEPSSSQSSSSETSSVETSSTESSPSVSGSSLVPSSQSTPSLSPVVSGVQVVPQALPQTGMDPGFLLMLGGMLVISGVLVMRYANDPS